MECKWTGDTKEEYETQYFGFGAQTIKIAFRNNVQSNIQRAAKNMESVLKSKVQFSDEDSVDFTKACDDLVALYALKSKDSLSVIDSELEKMMCIPDNVLLPEDEVHSKQYSEDDVNKIKQEIIALQKRAERAAIMEAYLKSELEELNACEPLFERATAAMDVHNFLADNINKQPKMDHILMNKTLEAQSLFEKIQKYSIESL